VFDGADEVGGKEAGSSLDTAEYHPESPGTHIMNTMGNSLARAVVGTMRLRLVLDICGSQGAVASQKWTEAERSYKSYYWWATWRAIT